MVVLFEAADVRNRLDELGLEEEPLKDVVRRGHLAYITCTANHPPSIPAIWAWGETVRALREYVLTLGWQRSNDRNYALVVDPEGRVAIAVATGDDGTGLVDASPSTKAPKGPSTVSAVNANQLRFSFMEQPESLPPSEPSSDPSNNRITWVLLIHRVAGEVRCELSLPSSMGPDGHIDDWRERILLGSVPFDSDMAEVAPPPQPDIAIPVTRRA